MTARRRLAALGSAAALAAALTACGGDTTGATGSSEPGTSRAASTASNDADVQFAQGMIVHHRGALEMAQLAPDRAQSGEVKALAEKIEAAQEPEIQTMTSWLEEWGEDVPEGTSMSMDDGMDMSMPEMMTEEQMTQLADASGAEFDRLFLELMTEHHQGAIEMAQTEQASGENPDAIALAETIEADQTREVAEMQRMLRGL